MRILGIDKKKIDNFQIDDVITKKEDAFSKELIIQTKFFRVESELLEVGRYTYSYYRNQKYHNLPDDKEVIFDILFKSTPQGEEFLIEPMQNGVDKLIININENANITLKKYGYADDYFSISKQDFIKCCEAKTIRFQLRRGNDIVYEDTTSRDDLLLYFQTLYHEAIDDTKYQDAKETLLIKCKKELDAYKEWEKKWRGEKEAKEAAKEATNKTLGYLMLFGGLIVLLIGILACCAVPSFLGILCIIGGALIAILSLVPFLQTY